MKTQESTSNSAIADMAKEHCFITELQRTFECVICCSPVRHPLVVQCILGCKECVRRWLVAAHVSGMMGEARIKGRRWPCGNVQASAH